MKKHMSYIVIGIILLCSLSGCGKNKDIGAALKTGLAIKTRAILERSLAQKDTAADLGTGTAAIPEVNTEAASNAKPGTDQGADEKTEREKRVSSMEKLLKTSLLPLGNTMYIWGGGWNEEDTGSGIESVTIGVSPGWAEFAARQNAGYDYNTTRYQIHDGLDCSGYIGWLVYNTFHTVANEEGYVRKAAKMAETFASYGWGNYLRAGAAMEDWRAGDICSMKGHVWMCLGSCPDGSVLLIHSSPPGVRICGTRLKDGSDSQAVGLAELCMGTYFPDWYSRYPECGVNYSYLESSSRMRWNSDTLPDAQVYQDMSAEEIIAFLF